MSNFHANIVQCRGCGLKVRLDNNTDHLPEVHRTRCLDLRPVPEKPASAPSSHEQPIKVSTEVER